MELLSTTAERTVCIQAGVTILFQFSISPQILKIKQSKIRLQFQRKICCSWIIIVIFEICMNKWTDELKQCWKYRWDPSSCKIKHRILNYALDGIRTWRVCHRHGTNSLPLSTSPLKLSHLLSVTSHGQQFARNLSLVNITDKDRKGSYQNLLYWNLLISSNKWLCFKFLEQCLSSERVVSLRR